MLIWTVGVDTGLGEESTVANWETSSCSVSSTVIQTVSIVKSLPTINVSKRSHTLLVDG